MTLYMRDLENREIGIEEGIEREQKRQIEKLLRKGKTVEEIVDFCDYPVELVEALQESLLVTQ